MPCAKTIALKAFAKINLSLDIIGVLDNGYHQLEMIMQSVSLSDHVIISLKERPNSISVSCSQPALCPAQQNTAYLAAKAFFGHCQMEHHAVSIHIEKQIPSRAGLAGGSADAAAVLHGLNQLYQANLSLEQLCQIGVMIGSDVPFCIRGGTMLAKGIGDELTALPPMPSCFIVICKPPVSVSTQEAYQKADSAMILDRPDTKRICTALEQKDLSAIARHLKNVFEQAMPIEEVQAIEISMKQHGALGACMSGSGSAVYGIFSTLEKATQCANQLKKQYRDVFVCEPTANGVQ